MTLPPGDPGHALMAARCARVPDVLREALDRALPPLPDALLRARRWVVTATGASEGPARLFASLLRRHAGRAADFAPLSQFAVGHARAQYPAGDALVLFSQGISSNARLALAARGAYAASLLVTAAHDHDDVLAATCVGFTVCAHPPDDENTLLLRILGPAAATLVACRLVERVLAHDGAGALFDEATWRAIPGATARAFDEGRAMAADAALVERLRGAVAFVTSPGLHEAAQGLRWKWLEGPGFCDPPCWDVLQFAHGPWQHVFDRPYTLVSLERGDDPLFERLASMLRREHHAMLRLRATLPGAAAFFEHDALVNALLCAATTRDLVQWPGRDADGPLYDLGR